MCLYCSKWSLNYMNSDPLVYLINFAWFWISEIAQNRECRGKIDSSKSISMFELRIYFFFQTFFQHIVRRGLLIFWYDWIISYLTKSGNNLTKKCVRISILCLKYSRPLTRQNKQIHCDKVRNCDRIKYNLTILQQMSWIQRLKKWLDSFDGKPGAKC